MLVIFSEIPGLLLFVLHRSLGLIQKTGLLNFLDDFLLYGDYFSIGRLYLSYFFISLHQIFLIWIEFDVI